MKHINNIPESVVEIIKMIIEELRPSKIVLFGSRARGDHQPGSDIDLLPFW